MDNYKRNIAKEYWDLSDKVESLEKTLSNPQFEKNVGSEIVELTRQRLSAMLTELDILSRQVKLLEPFNCNFGNCNENKNENFINRDTLLDEAELRCLREMYRKSQPAGDYDEYLRQLREGEIKEEIGEEIYRRHYLSREEFKYILDKYVNAYGMEDYWNKHFDLLEEYMTKNGIIEKDDGFEHLPDLEDIFKEMLKKWEDVPYDCIAVALKEAVIERIEQCRNFYRHGTEEGEFRATVALACGSPTSNKEEVKNYWKKMGIDIEIIDRDPDKFWPKDYYEELNE